jgi:hypothetical protein
MWNGTELLTVIVAQIVLFVGLSIFLFRRELRKLTARPADRANDTVDQRGGDNAQAPAA